VSNFTTSLKEAIPLGCQNVAAQARLATALAKMRAEIKVIVNANVKSTVVRERVLARSDERLVGLMRLLAVDLEGSPSHFVCKPEI
jgi:hypothetical protein